MMGRAHLGAKRFTLGVRSGLCRFSLVTGLKSPGSCLVQPSGGNVIIPVLKRSRRPRVIALCKSEQDLVLPA